MATSRGSYQPHLPPPNRQFAPPPPGSEAASQHPHHTPQPGPAPSSSPQSPAAPYGTSYTQQSRIPPMQSNLPMPRTYGDMGFSSVPRQPSFQQPPIGASLDATTSIPRQPSLPTSNGGPLPAQKQSLPRLDTSGTAVTKPGDKQSTGPKEYIGRDKTRKYQLHVVQQPQRARMCGFGDKDRRPITPPPCIRVAVIDLATNKEVDVNELSHQHYVLHVDLWNEDGTAEVNMVKHNHAATTINTGAITSFQDVIDSPGFRMGQYSNTPYGSQANSAGYASSSQAYPASGSTTAQSYGYPSQVNRDNQTPAQTPHPFGGNQTHDLHTLLPSSGGVGRMSLSQNGSSCTRNLIGSASNSSARLVDRDDKIGIWFVLQDLSIRTEGIFRLRFTFINTLKHGVSNPAGVSDPKLLNKKVCKVLALKFSEPFQVFSAKKFPGVCESTALSRKFALQGVKIPIRKDGADGNGKGKNKKRRRDEDDDDEDEDEEGDY